MIDNTATTTRPSKLRRCTRCGRWLRHPDAVRIGLGPTCAADVLADLFDVGALHPADIAPKRR